MDDKFNLSRRENIFLAKKTIVNNIYNSARLEGINVTFPQTKTILDGMSVSNLDIDDVQKILNLRNAWRYLFNHIDDEFTLEFIEKINGYVAYNESLEWGVLRNGNVGIYGVNYKPTIPVRNDVVEKIKELNRIESVTERAIIYMLWAMRSQLFWDGNKRTSIICANKLLIQYGKGILTIPDTLLEDFNILLSEFYDTNDYGKISDFIYDKCIFGITCENEVE